jgi:hypothetical protein
MPITYKILGQIAPAPASNTMLYVVPAGSNTVVSTLNVCNMGFVPSTFRAMLRPANTQVMAPQHFIAYDTWVPPNDTIVITAGFTLATTDAIYVYANTANLSFNVFGSEIS